MRASHLLTAAIAIAALAAAPVSATASGGGVSTPASNAVAAPKTDALSHASIVAYMSECTSYAVRNAGPKASCTWQKMPNFPGEGPCYILRAYSPKWKQWFGGAWRSSNPCYAPLKKG